MSLLPNTETTHNSYAAFGRRTSFTHTVQKHKAQWHLTTLVKNMYSTCTVSGLYLCSTSQGAGSTPGPNIADKWSSNLQTNKQTKTHTHTHTNKTIVRCSCECAFYPTSIHVPSTCMFIYMCHLVEYIVHVHDVKESCLTSIPYATSILNNNNDVTTAHHLYWCISLSLSPSLALSR
jgi:hypothetical protein